MKSANDDLSQEELFEEEGAEPKDEAQTKERSSKVLARLYPEMCKTEKVKTRTLTEKAYDAGAWTILSQREANIRCRLPSTQTWLDHVDEAGVQRGYKTEDGYRKPIEQCTLKDLDFDLLADVKQARADERKIRQKIITRLFRYGVKDFPKDIPAHIWSEKDMAHYQQVRRRGDLASMAAD